MTLPYASATSGRHAIDDIRRIVLSFGCSKFAPMEDFATGQVTVQFEYRGRMVQVTASTTGYAAALLREKPYTTRMRKSRAQYEAAALEQGQIAVWSILRDWIKGQITADERIPFLLDTPAAVRFVSVEPMLGAVNLARLGIREDGDGFLDALAGRKWVPGVGSINSHTTHTQSLDWVIVGGESGPKARPMHPDWARSLRDQCQAAGVSFFLKQMTRKAPIPDDLRIREFPR